MYYRSCCEAKVTDRVVQSPSQTPERGFSQMEHGVPTSQVVTTSRVQQQNREE